MSNTNKNKVAKKAPTKRKTAAKKAPSNKVTYLSSLEQKILTSNLGEKLKKERLEVKVAEKTLKTAQEKTLNAEQSLNAAREEALSVKEEFMKLQDELQMAKAKANKSETEAKRKDMQLAEQTINAQEAISKRLEEEYQETLRQIEEAESKALKARKESEETYNKISEEVLTEVEQTMKEKIETELDQMGEKTQIIDMVRNRISKDEVVEDEIEIMKIKNEEAAINQDAAKSEAQFLKESDDVAKEAYAKEKLGLGKSNDKTKNILMITGALVLVILTILVSLLAVGVI